MTLQLEKMTREEKLHMMEMLWIDLSRHEEEIISPNWHKDVLELREKEIKSNQEKFKDWESAKKELRNLTP